MEGFDMGVSHIQSADARASYQQNGEIL